MALPLAVVVVLALCQAQGEHAPLPVLEEGAGRIRSVTDLTDRERRLVASFGRPIAVRPQATNAWADYAPAVELGRALFFDPGLSGNGEISCATCHNPETGWADARAKAKGAGIGPRNTPSVVNAASGLWQGWDGRADSLWSQALQPIESDLEMNGSRVAAVLHVASSPELRRLWNAAFGELGSFTDTERFPRTGRPHPVRPEDPFGGPTTADLEDPDVRAWESMAAEDQQIINVVFSRIGKSIEAYERTLLSGQAPFDVLAEGLRTNDDEKTSALGPTELMGMRLFFGRANCVACHFGPTFSDLRFHNVGLPRLGELAPSAARTEGIRALRVDPMNGRGAHSDATDWQANRKLLYLRSSEHLVGAYKTPSLRDVTRTAPYGHDGRFATLRDVLDFYSELPGRQEIGHREETLKPLRFTEEEKDALLAFLESLTGAAVTR